MAITYQQAMTRLNSVTTVEQLSEVILELDLNTPQGKTVLYSGVVANGDGPGGSPIRAVDIARRLGSENTGINIIDNTDAGRFLSTGDRDSGRNRTLYNKLSELFDGDESRINAYLYGDTDAQGRRVANGIWDQLSERFVSRAQGDVITISGGARSDGCFAQVELPALLRNPAVTSIDGIPVEVLRSLSPEQAFRMVSANSELRTARIGIPLDSDGQSLAADGGVPLDSREFLNPDFAPEDADAPSSGQYRRLQDYLPAERVQRHLTAIREIQQSLDASPVSSPTPDLPPKPGALRLLGPLDRALTALDLVLTAEDVRRRLVKGDRSGAEQVARTYVTSTAGSLAGGRLVGSLVTPLASAGPQGMAAAAVLTIAGAVVGGNVAGPALNSLAEELGRWSVPLGDALADLWKGGVGMLGELGEVSKALLRWGDSILSTLKRLFGLAETTFSPLVLDLDGNGVVTLSIQAGLHFDHDGNGFAERSGWVGAGDGILVRDLQGDGQISSGAELFGNATRRRDGSLAPHGFAALSDLDGNGDGQVDGRDQGWSSLQIWLDGDSDALTDPGELHSLESLGVRALPLAFQNATIVDAQGNHHRQIGTYRHSDGGDRALVDVWFQVDQAQTRQLHLRSVPDAIAVLPDLPGMGHVASLHQTMAADPDGALVRLVEQWCASDSNGRAALIEQILITWTGVQARGLADSSQNAAFRRVLALEQLIGRSFRNTPTTQLPRPHALVALEQCFRAVSQELDLLLTAQYEVAPLVSLLQRPSTADRTLRFDASQVLTAVRERLRIGGDRGLLVQMVQAMGRMGEIGTEMLAALQKAGVNQPDSVGRILDAMTSPGTQLQNGSIHTDHLHGGSGPDWLVGLEGADNLYANEGNDVLDGGRGNDRMLGGSGDDLYLIANDPGDDHILDNSGEADELHLIDFNPSSVRFERQGSDLLVVHGSGSVRVIHHFMADWARIERLSFSDGTSWNEQNLIDNLVIGGASNGDDNLGGYNQHSNRIDGLGGHDNLRGGRHRDQLSGGPGNDQLQGAENDDLLDGGSGDDVLFGDEGVDTLISGGGNDRLSGGSGNDLYRISGHFDTLWINDQDGSPNNHDRVFFDGLSSSQVRAVERRHDNLLLNFDGGSQLTIPFYFLVPSSRVESFHFSDGSSWSEQNLLQRLQTSPFLAPTTQV